MGPRKRAKPNPKPGCETEEHSGATNASLSETQTGTGTSNLSLSSTVETPKAPSLLQNSVTPPIKAWYSSGWPHGYKSGPVTQVAKDSITAAVGVASEAVTTARTRTPPSSGSLNKSATDTGDPSLTTIGNSRDSHGEQSKKRSKEGNKRLSRATIEANEIKGSVPGKYELESSQATQEPGDDGSQDLRQASPQLRQSSNRQSASWISWFQKRDENHLSHGQALADLEPNKSGIESRSEGVATENAQTNQSHGEALSRASGLPELSTNETNKRGSWLKFWNNSDQSQNRRSTSTTPETTSGALNASRALVSQDRILPNSESIPSVKSEDLPKSIRVSSWAFLSRNEKPQTHPNEIGELALAGSPSQGKPEKDTIDNAKGVPAKVAKSQAIEAPNDQASNDPIVQQDARQAKKQTVTQPKVTGNGLNERESSQQSLVPNLVLPSFKNTFDSVSKPGFVQQVTRMLPFTSILPPPKHLEITSNPPRIRRVLVIGIHGYFPAALIRSLIGQPTGTSVRFASSAANAVRKWMDGHGYSCEIEKVALEGEGKIAERTEVLWNLLLNWIEKIRQADFVFVACHSQGCPVAMLLVAKLIDFGCVSRARIGICAMAGINQGPFVDYKTRLIGATALELFEYAKDDSILSVHYRQSLETALKFGAKILYVGSIDDQLVSLESSTFGSMHHPNIYRAVFVDGRVHAPDFLSHLVGFALKLRNLGVSDHGLIRELSGPLAGSLYSGEGHSRLYEDEAVYYLAVEHALETGASSGISMQFRPTAPSTGQNPYILPFAMRGLLEEEFVRVELRDEIASLIKQFDEWKPSSKILKDVKWRLEGVRSKL